MATTFAPSRVLVDRWDRALERAHAAGITALPVAGRNWYAVTSSDQSMVYMADRDRCTCPAGQHGDPVCQHRALVRELTAPQPEPPAPAAKIAEMIPCTQCSGSGWDCSILSNWDAYRCERCAGTGRVPVPAPGISNRIAQLVQRLETETASLAKIDDQLAPMNYAIEYGNGRVNAQQHERLSALRQTAQERVDAARATLVSAQNGAGEGVAA